MKRPVFSIIAAGLWAMGCLGAVALQAEPSTTTPANAVQIVELKNSRVGFFSSIGGPAFARLEFAGLGPAQRKWGPFLIAAPGVAMTQPRLSIFPEACTDGDWATLTAHLARLQRAQLSQPLEVTLPDGRELAASRFPLVQGRRLIFGRAQVRAADGALDRPQTVVVAFTGDAAHVVDSLPSPGLAGSVEPRLENPPSTTLVMEGTATPPRFEPTPAAP